MDAADSVTAGGASGYSGIDTPPTPTAPAPPASRGDASGAGGSGAAAPPMAPDATRAASHAAAATLQQALSDARVQPTSPRENDLLGDLWAMRRDGAYAGSGTATPERYWEHLAGASREEAQAAWDDAGKLGIARPETSCLDAQRMIRNGAHPSSEGVMDELDAARRFQRASGRLTNSNLGHRSDGPADPAERGRQQQRYWQIRNGLSDAERSEADAICARLGLNAAPGLQNAAGAGAGPQAVGRLTPENLVDQSDPAVNALVRTAWKAAQVDAGTPAYADAVAEGNRQYAALNAQQRQSFADKAAALDLHVPIDGVRSTNGRASNGSAFTSGTAAGQSEQGRNGDCAFLSSLNAVETAPQGRERLDAMISSSPDAPGLWRVRFPGDPSRPVDVRRDELPLGTDADLGNRTHQILEVAANKYYAAKGEKGVLDGANTGRYASLLTGHDPAADVSPPRSINAWQAVGQRITGSPPEIPETTRAQIIADIRGMRSGQTAVAGVDYSEPNMWMSDGHAVTIERYDPVRDAVTWSNPWDQSAKYTQSVEAFVDDRRHPSGIEGNFALGQVHSLSVFDV